MLSLSLTQELSLNASQLTGLRFDFFLGKEMICNISSKAAPAVFVRWITMDDIFFFFLSLASVMFNFWLQGTSHLLEGRDILTQCSLGLRAWELPQPGFLVMLQLKLGSILLISGHVQFRVKKIGCVCASVLGFPYSSVGKESTCNAGDPGLIPGLGRSSGEGIGYPLQYSWASLVAQLVKNPPAMWKTWVQYLGWEDPMEKGKATCSSILAWRIPWTVWSMDEVTKSWIWLSNFHKEDLVPMS